MVARLQQQTGGSVVTSKTLLVFSVVVVLASGAIWAGGADTISADGGDIKITPILHGSVQVEFGGLAIYLDPWTRGDYSQAPVADLILVTDIHGDHLDTEAIGKLSQEKTTLIVPEAAAGQVEGETVMANGEKVEISGVGIEAVPMYNLKRGPEEGKVFHDRGRGNGYILTLGGKRVYFAGDTACTPDMKALEEIDVAFVPMNLPYTMPPAEAAECVRAFAPKIVYPYHYRGSDLDEFTSALEDEPEIEVRIREWYPGS
jgi:L-ascorbate metabolism protein UlaG (beta-lactamase superfamily)